MELVVDANIVMSAIIASDGRTAELLFDCRLRLVCPDLLFDEVRKHLEDVQRKSGLTDEEANLAITLIQARINSVPLDEFKSAMPEASKITPDPDDTEYFALAMKRGCALWSNEKRLKRQDEVKVWSTSELIEMLG